MGTAKVQEFKSSESGAKQVSSLPLLPYDYYGVAINDVDSTEWIGGEVCYLTGDNRYYVQTATSGTTATWKRKLEATVTA